MKNTQILGLDLSFRHCGLCFFDTGEQKIELEEIKGEMGQNYLQSAWEISTAILQAIKRQGGVCKVVVECPLLNAPCSGQLNMLCGFVCQAIKDYSPDIKIILQRHTILEKIRGTGKLSKKKKSIFAANFCLSALQKKGWKIPLCFLGPGEDGPAEALLHCLWFLFQHFQNQEAALILSKAQSAIVAAGFPLGRGAIDISPGFTCIPKLENAF